jgi:hypothetical protein
MFLWTIHWLSSSGELSSPELPPKCTIRPVNTVALRAIS